MSKNTKVNIAMLIGFAVLFGGAFALGRTETLSQMQSALDRYASD